MNKINKWLIVLGLTLFVVSNTIASTNSNTNAIVRVKDILSDKDRARCIELCNQAIKNLEELKKEYNKEKK